MAYTSTNPLFKSLTDEEEQKFREYARNNPPKNSEWNICHPVCREEWTKQGYSPNNGEW